MSSSHLIPRRTILKGTALAGLGGAVSPWAVGPADASNHTVGFIYVGPKDDYGSNQAHAEGAAALKGMSDGTVIEEENVPETVAVQKTIESAARARSARHCNRLASPRAITCSMRRLMC